MEQAVLIDVPPMPGDSDERYTTRETLRWCMDKAGAKRIDLDVAACEESHCAPVWYDKMSNGLVQPWFGIVWCNNPWSDNEPWVERCAEMTVSRDVEMVLQLLPGDRTEQPWWQEWIEPHRDRSERLRTYFLPGRTRYGIPGNPNGIRVGSPNFTSVLLVWKR